MSNYDERLAYYEEELAYYRNELEELIRNNFDGGLDDDIVYVKKQISEYEELISEYDDGSDEELWQQQHCIEMGIFH